MVRRMDAQRLFTELCDATPAECIDVVLLGASIAAHKQATTPRDILERCWKALDDERHRTAMAPVLEAVCSPAL